MDFMNMVKTELDNTNLVATENGALGYASTGSALLDINFSTMSLRSASEEEIIEKFTKAYYENKSYALVWLFFARDVREGMGERRLFKVIFNWLCATHTDEAKVLLHLISEYGRWDDVLCALETVLQDEVIALVKEQLARDIAGRAIGTPISLLAKWLPSPTTSSKETKRLAKIVYTGLDMKEADYRKMLSLLRAYLDVVEVKISANRWSEINYSAVPSKANLLYNAAFFRHDEERRTAYLNRVQNGEEKINAGTLYPSDIVHQYIDYYRVKCNTDTTLEELWKALPDYVNGQGNTICVADGSGSMMSAAGGNSSVTCLEVANALAIYFAEHSSGCFANKYITFSNRPQFVDFSNAKTLREKLEVAYRHNEMSNTNIERVFDLLLSTAITNRLPQSEIPNVLILSDLEFDQMTCDDGNYRGCRPTLFKEIEQKWNSAGYQLPKLTFWNIACRSGAMPVNTHENFPVALVSGYSLTVMEMVLSNEADPYKCLIKMLDKARYDAVRKALE